MMALAACSSFNEPKRLLPGPPAYAQEVRAPDPRPDEQCYPVALRERVGRLKANTIIRAMKADWSTMKATYAKGR